MGTVLAKREDKVNRGEPCPVKPRGFQEESSRVVQGDHSGVDRGEGARHPGPERPQSDSAMPFQDLFRQAEEKPDLDSDHSEHFTRPSDGDAGSSSTFRPFTEPDTSMFPVPLTRAGGDGGVEPPLLRELHSQSLCCVPHCFEGAKVTVRRLSCGRWSLIHRISLSGVIPGGYRIGARRGKTPGYENKQPDDLFKLIAFDVDPDGNLNVETRMRPCDRGRLSLRAQMCATSPAKVLQAAELTGDWLAGEKNAISLTLAAPKLAVFQISRAVSPRLTFGGELAADGASRAAASLACRWDAEDGSGGWSGCVGSRGLELWYWTRAGPQLRLASQLELTPRGAAAALCWRWTACGWTARARLDSYGLVGCTLERALLYAKGEMCATLAFSALINHVNNKFKLGFGVHTEINC